MSRKLFIQVAGSIFLLVAALHGLRIVFGWGVEIGNFRFPLCVSIVAIGIAGFMAYQAFKLAMKEK